MRGAEASWQRPRAGGRRPAGFTLLELLVAMVLLGLLSGLLYGGLRIGSQVWAGGETMLMSLEQVQTARNTLYRVIGRAVPRRDLQITKDGILFEGLADRIDFVGLRPAEAMTGTLFWLRLAVASGADGNELVLSWRPLVVGDAPPEAYADDETVVLLAGFTSLRFRYFGLRGQDDTGLPDWYEDWRAQFSLPALVRIEVAFADDDTRPWADLVIATMIQAWPSGRAAAAGAALFAWDATDAARGLASGIAPGAARRALF